jgi:hypothetical protein
LTGSIPPCQTGKRSHRLAAGGEEITAQVLSPVFDTEFGQGSYLMTARRSRPRSRPSASRPTWSRRATMKPRLAPSALGQAQTASAAALGGVRGRGITTAGQGGGSSSSSRRPGRTYQRRFENRLGRRAAGFMFMGPMSEGCGSIVDTGRPPEDAKQGAMGAALADGKFARASVQRGIARRLRRP